MRQDIPNYGRAPEHRLFENLNPKCSVRSNEKDGDPKELAKQVHMKSCGLVIREIFTLSLVNLPMNFWLSLSYFGSRIEDLAR